MDRTIRKLGTEAGSVLIVAKKLTVEARQVANEAGCDIVLESDFGWTDVSYQNIWQGR